ncbi:MerR family transcriptional regulator [Metabacillus iocasae]|uniref:DNA-binding transcriptional MerR regulator n=1 Tax=Priestia iocasae TaxID=2291674 RepID=A0ABS2QT34_9BACI|nr:MerR family transcriptional regulator [Metabacillus iocasae]MBM7702187.1 DNA-binding transcriptional MerR regulator [Metabacillus iocasae]
MEHYTIKKVSDALRVDKRTLKQWEDQLEGYIKIERINNARVYRQEQMELFKDVRELVEQKVSWPDIREYVQLMTTESLQQVATSEEDLVTATEDVMEPVGEEESELEKQKEQVEEDEIGTALSLSDSEHVHGELIDKAKTYEDVFAALDSFKKDLLSEMRQGIRNEVREEIISEVKKEIEKGNHQTAEIVESVEAFIAESSERNVKEVENISKKIIRTNELAFEEIANVMDDITDLSKDQKEETMRVLNEMAQSSDESSKEMQYLLDRFSSNSTVAMNQVKFMVEKLTNSSSTASEELRDLIDSMNEERIYFLKEMEKDRKIHRQNISEREQMFSEFVQGFRQAAAAEAKRTNKKWWKVWKE